MVCPTGVLNCGNSGTAMRLLAGVLAGQSFDSVLIGDASLCRRPMERIAEPLRLMGAEIRLEKNEFAPVRVSGRKLRGVNYELPVASAQVKSALLLAGLLAEGETRLMGRLESRDHTERLLPVFGVSLRSEKNLLSIEGEQKIHSASVRVPGDPSAAAFWMTAAALLPGSSVEFENIGLNPTRTGFLKVLERMGAKVEVEITGELPEPVGRLCVSHAPLSGILISEKEVPHLIDEIPLLAILGASASGRTEIHGSSELRFKESDRIQMISENFKAMGVGIETMWDGFSVTGPQPFRGALIRTGGDHRIAMGFSIAALAARGASRIQDAACVSVSYPGFFDTLAELLGER